MAIECTPDGYRSYLVQIYVNGDPVATARQKHKESDRHITTLSLNTKLFLRKDDKVEVRVTPLGATPCRYRISPGECQLTVERMRQW